MNSILEKFAVIFSSECYLDFPHFLCWHSLESLCSDLLRGVYRYSVLTTEPIAVSSKYGIFGSTMPTAYPYPPHFICSVGDNVGSLPCRCLWGFIMQYSICTK